GVLELCEASGVAALYPGRDVVTVERRMLALVSFDVAATGALLFEAVIADAQDFSVLPVLLDRADPRGAVRAAMLTPGHTSSFARLLGQPLGVEDMAGRLRRGYERRFGVGFRERKAPAVPTFDDGAWLRERALRAGLDRHAAVDTQLGVLEAYLAVG